MALRLSSLLSVLLVARGRWALSAALRALGDRYLADMGIERDGIDAHVRSSLPWPEAAPASEPGFAPSLQGCG